MDWGVWCPLRLLLPASDGLPGDVPAPARRGTESTVPFQCDEGLVLSGSTTCQRAIPEGQSCQGMGVLDEVCAPGLHCDPDSRVCQRFASAGESCDPANGRSCAWTLFCDEGTCQKRGREGDSCTATSASSILSYHPGCQQGLFCDADPGAAGSCRELRRDGRRRRRRRRPPRADSAAPAGGFRGRAMTAPGASAPPASTAPTLPIPANTTGNSARPAMNRRRVDSASRAPMTSAAAPGPARSAR